MNYLDPEEIAIRRPRKIKKTEIEHPEERNTMGCLNRIVKRLSQEEYSESLLADMSEDTSYVCEKFAISPIQSVLLGVIVEESYLGIADKRDIARAFSVTNFELIGLIKEIEAMSKMHIIRITDRPRGMGFEVYSEVLDAIINDEPYRAPSNEGLDTEEIFTRMRKLFSEFFDYALTNDLLLEEIQDLIEKNPQSIFCQKVRESSIPTDFDRLVFLYLCHLYRSHGDSSANIEDLMRLLDSGLDDTCWERKISREELSIQKMGLVEFKSENGFVNTSRICLTEMVCSEFFKELQIDSNKSFVPLNPDLKSHTSIVKKTLFYNDKEKEQMERIERLLNDDNFKDVQQRLKEQGMRKGVNIIMYGPAGTGKTESCLQLARKTGRDIFIVDVTKLKNKFVGDSEKAVRELFMFYRRLVRQSEKAPILLFNEADAIFGVRMKGAEHSVDKMNNTIQNIILQEMETLEGVLIATTNLETNLDPAFERRFLFKIHFTLPEENAREKIWQSMLPSLSQNDALHLARNFLFSGGQIENVARKSIIEYIICGKKSGLDELSQFCNEERFGGPSTRTRQIGFNVA